MTVRKDLPADTQPRRRRGTPRDTSAASAARWSPEGRRAEAIRIIVEQASELTPEQLDALHGALVTHRAKS